MTPLHITMLLHFHATPEPYAKHDPGHANSEAVEEFTANLLAWDLIRRDDRSGSGFRTTPRGDFFIGYLTSLPLPIPDWRMPAPSISSNKSE